MKIYKLSSNKNISFIGLQLTGKGFVLSKEKAKELIQKDSKNSEVIKKFLIGRDLNQRFDQSPSRMVIDFQDWPLERALKYKELIHILENTVKQERLESKSTGSEMKKIRKYWWQYQRLGQSMIEKLKDLDKFIVTSRVSVHRLFVMIKNDDILPDKATVVFSSNSTSFLGILSSKFHVEWIRYNNSTFGAGSRYTNTTCFETFPFPEQKEDPKVASIMEGIEAYRRKACQESQQGLTTLYNQMFQGKLPVLKDYHKKLDQAVADLYGFPKEKLQSKREILKFLISLNHEFYETLH